MARQFPRVKTGSGAGRTQNWERAGEMLAPDYGSSDGAVLVRVLAVWRANTVTRGGLG